ncbi:MAG: RNA-binding protein [Lachnospiraceae bacterium]|nr:RNA-binding protein [Lachnospiraceae bacterium]
MIALSVVKSVDFGVYLGTDKEKVLLPAKQVPEGTKVGDVLQVFIYKDSDDRTIATRKEVKLTLGEIALLRVRQVTSVGAFLDWGLEKDLLLPFREQPEKVKEGDEVLVALYIDKSGRLAATMRLYPYLEVNSPYKTGDLVKARVYETSDNFGVFAAVEDRYTGLIPKKEVFTKFPPGKVLEARVTKVHEDGKLNLSVRKESYLQMDDDAEKLYKMLEDAGGALPFSDRSDPEDIRLTFSMSKNAFKRAIGRLLKERKITLTEKGIEIQVKSDIINP